MAVNSYEPFDGAACWSKETVSGDSHSSTTADERVLFNVNNARLSEKNRNNNSNNNSNSSPTLEATNRRIIILKPDEHIACAAANEQEELKNSSPICQTEQVTKSVITEKSDSLNSDANVLETTVQSNTISNDNSVNEDMKIPVAQIEPEIKNAEGSSVVVDEEERDPDLIEERFRVDRRKLEQMLQAAASGQGQGGEDFFNEIMEATSTNITWPSKLKIGAKSKKDPHIKVAGKQENVSKAKEMVMKVLDTKCTRVTLKMDVSHNEHSHVIGKGGNNIKRVMEETGCHIHFPDSNRTSSAEKSNQVSIAGQPMGVESARSMIRDLLPIVISFDLSMTGAIPDPNSPPIQHIVLTHNISVQFKQRAKVYCTTCTIRGSNDNVTGLLEGSKKLMQHLTGSIVPVSSQIEVAPQQHAYMLGKDASNVKHIMHRTGAQIRFPDPNSLPKKSTIYVNGAVEAVLMARQRLMGCLPLVLMFDMKQEGQSATEEAVKNCHLMETLDVFISIKLKPKQPSKSVIVKSVERNIHNMFEARRQLLDLPTSGLKTSPAPASPQPISMQPPNAVTSANPVIRLTHPPSPHMKPQYISILQPNIALMNGAMSPISRTVTPVNPMLQNWSNSPMISPAQSPYPMSQQATVAAIHAQQQQHLILQAQLNAQQQQLTAAVIASGNPSRGSSIAGSPPLLARQDGSDLQGPNIPISVAQQAKRQFIKGNPNDVEYGYTSRSTFSDRQPNRGNPRIEPPRHYDENEGLIDESWAETDGVPMNKYHPYESEPSNISSNVRGLQRHILTVQHQMGSLSANSSFNKGNSAPLEGHRHSISTENISQEAAARLKQRGGSLNENLEFSKSGNRRNFIGSQNSPPGSDRDTPISGKPEVPVTSDNSGKQNLLSVYRSPSSSASSAELQSSLRGMHRSPTRGQYLHPDRAMYDQPVDSSSLYEGVKNAYISAAESKNEADMRELKEYFHSPAPPPGFEQYPLPNQSPLTELDYESRRQVAYKAMQHRPVATEIRKPTDTWSGLGFSLSMPNNQLKQEKEKYKLNLTTTYEGDDSSIYEEAESAEMNHLAMSQDLANSSKGSSALSSWRERNNRNLSHSLHSKVGNLANSMPKRKQHSTFDPLPKEYMNHSIPPPPHPNDEPSSPPTYPPTGGNGGAGDPVTRLQGGLIANQPLEAALSVLSDTHLGGQSNCIELHDLLRHLNLEKYSEVFTKQEVDLQTFLTLTESDLTELGITIFGPKKKILMAIEELKKNRNVLYSNNLNPSHPHLSTQSPRLPTNPPPRMLGELLPNSGKHNSPPMGANQANMLSTRRLVHNARGTVSQSGRW